MAGRFELVIRGPRVVSAAGEAPAWVGVRGGRVAATEPLGARLAGDLTVTLADSELICLAAALGGG